MDVDEMLNEISKPRIYRDTIQRFAYNWFFEIPTSGSIIFRNILFFNDVFLNTVGFGILEKFITNMEIFVYDLYNTENFQQILTIDDLKNFNENNTYKERRYIVGKHTILIQCRFKIMLAYKKTLNMDLNNY